MKPIEEDDLNRMLAGIKHNVPDSTDTFDHILKRVSTSSPQRIKYLQLRNAGIAMLLIITINVVIVSATGKKTITETNQQQQPDYLQPYNLNLY